VQEVHAVHIHPQGQPAAGLPSGVLTFLFTDIEGSTRRWEQDPVAMRGALARHDALLQEAVAAQDGWIFKNLGDGVCAVFRSAPAGLAAALQAQEALQAAEWGPAGALRVRMALHTEWADAHNGDYHGPPLNRVARLLAAGHGGQILFSQDTREAIREHLPPGVTLRDLGIHRLKDLSQPEHIFQAQTPDLPSRFPPLRTAGRPGSRLPAYPTPPVDRVQETEKAMALLQSEDVRLLTFSGPGGVGKTRLAVRIAADLRDAFADGVYFVSLAPIADPRLVLSTIAQALGLHETGARSVRDALVVHLEDKEILLLLDNFEQVADAGPEIADLVWAAPRLKVLITSREVLHLYGEYHFVVPPLALPNLHALPELAALQQIEAVSLFVNRARSIRPDFALTAENAADVADICTRLDGLPLAIEVAAAGIRTLPPAALLERLEHRLAVLPGGARDLPARQQTLRGMLDWSYALLDDEERHLFARLAVFVDGAAVAAMLAVCGVDEFAAGRLLERLAALIDKSLVQQAAEEDDAPRFGMLQIIREYALERLDESAEAAALRDRHAQFFLQLAERAALELRGEEQEQWLDRLEREHANLRAALRWALGEATVHDAELALRLVDALWMFWHVRGYLSEGRRWLEETLAKSRRLPAVLRAPVYFQAGVLAMDQGDYPAARTRYEESLLLFRDLRDPAGQARTLVGLGVLAENQGDYEQAKVLTQESLALRRRLGDNRGIAMALNNLGNLALDHGTYAEARALYEESLTLLQKLGDVQLIGVSLNNLGHVAQMQEDYAAAQALHEQSLALKRRLGDKVGIASALNSLGDVARRQEDGERAGMLYQESLAVYRDLGDRAGIAGVLDNLGYLALQGGNPAAAQGYLRESLALLRDLGDKRGLARCLLHVIAATDGQEVTAAQRSVRLLGAVDTLLATIDVPLDAADRADFAHSLVAARTRLEAGSFAAAWTAGQRLTLEQAITEAVGPFD
jgi:predicted ATPase/class 3 adenylate cyclase